MDPIRDCFEEGLAMTGNEEEPKKKYEELTVSSLLKFIWANPGCLGIVVAFPIVMLLLILVLKFI